jgi:ABC-2 type transport system ATP-binding protein
MSSMLVDTDTHQTETTTNQTEIAITCRQACKRFVEKVEGSRSLKNGFRGRKKWVHAVDHVSFDVKRGEIFGILGPNGSGKSTLIRLISTLLLPDKGTITVFGKDLSIHHREVRRWMNRVSVEASFFKKLSAVENLRYAARLYGLPVDEAQEQALGILSRLGISRNKAFSPLETHSRGMQQKVDIARALMTSPVPGIDDLPRIDFAG